MTLNLDINKNYSCIIEYIGNTKIPILIIEDWLDNPLDLINYPPQNLDLWKMPSTLYPGIWSALPETYLPLLLKTLAPFVKSLFHIPFEPVSISSFYGIMTKNPSELTLFQKAPHVDTLCTPQLATVHYLCDESHAGTSFCRHRKTGYETITIKQWNRYRSILEEELRGKNSEYMGYIDGDNDYFERIKECKVKFNRLLVYPSQVLHSGILKKKYISEDGIASARLTANSFIGYYVIGP